MSFADAQFAYDNMSEPDYQDENPAVIESLIVKFQEEYPVYFSEHADDDFTTLLMRIATNEQPDDAIVQPFIAMIRNHYEKELSTFIENNYEKENDAWSDEQFDYEPDEPQEDLNAECAW